MELLGQEVWGYIHKRPVGSPLQFMRLSKEVFTGRTDELYTPGATPPTREAGGELLRGFFLLSLSLSLFFFFFFFFFWPIVARSPLCSLFFFFVYVCRGRRAFFDTRSCDETNRVLIVALRDIFFLLRGFSFQGFFFYYFFYYFFF
jgi:hypothetical protein